MRILYIGRNLENERPTSGAEQVNKRNIALLKQICGNIIYVEPQMDGFVSKSCFGITSTVLRKIDEITNIEIGCVFVSWSMYGKACRYIHKHYPNIPIITFFHDIERQYASSYLKSSGLKAFPFYLASYYWEKVTCNHSDFFITLNNRDTALLLDIYKKRSNIELPTSFEDSFSLEKLELCSSLPEIDMLFVGAAFYPNIKGVQWFIDNVMPHTKACFYIVGKGMDKVQFRNLSENIHILGFVNDLSEYYYRSKIVVSPIFDGGGMKTKTAEALMYGRNIIGTNEAFEGYDIDSHSMLVANTAEEFLSAINESSYKTKYNKYARDLFLHKYSNEIAQLKLRKFIEAEIKI